jgi:predicted ArsR family transcriptional regulator
MGQTAETFTHRALADERRAALLEALRQAPDGLDVHELAAGASIHANTARWHLGVLADAGLVESQPGPSGAPGRPRTVYRATAEATGGGRDEYRLLATMLTGSLSTLEDGPARAADAGAAWGRYLVRSPLPLARVPDEQAKAEVVALLDEQGFATDADGDAVNLRRCPFPELAESHPEIVCNAHRGLIDGAFEELGSDLRVEQLDVFVRPDLCVARLGVRA